MESKGIRSRRRLLDIPVGKAPVEDRLIAVASLMVPVDDMRIIEGGDRHALTIGSVDCIRIVMLTTSAHIEILEIHSIRKQSEYFRRFLTARRIGGKTKIVRGCLAGAIGLGVACHMNRRCRALFEPSECVHCRIRTAADHIDNSLYRHSVLVIAIFLE